MSRLEAELGAERVLHPQVQEHRSGGRCERQARMHFKVWKRVKKACRSAAFCGDPDLVRTQSQGVGSKNDTNDSRSPAFPDAGRPPSASRQSQPLVAAGQCALQGETSLSLQTR